VRPRLIVPLAATVIAAAVAIVIVAGDGDGDDEGAARTGVASAVADQLGYLDPDSSLVLAIDMRYENRNWEHLRELISKGLREYGALADEEEFPVPLNVTGALNQLASFAGLSFDQDVKPLLDGYVVLGVTVPPRRPLPPEIARIEEQLDGAQPARGGRFQKSGRILRDPDGRPLTFEDSERVFEAEERISADAEPAAVVTYKTGSDGLPRVVDKLLEGDEPKPLEGSDKVKLIDPTLAMVDDDTLVFAEGDGESDGDSSSVVPGEALEAALERGRGYPVERLAHAQRASGAGDPLVLASGDLNLARLLVEEPNLLRTRREIDWLAAIDELSAALSIDEDGLDAVVQADTDRAQLDEDDLPVGGAGQVELPERDDAIVSGTRDQSVTTAFMASLARALFEDSRFVDAVERAERELGIDFEQEFLRQFGCPSVSVFEPEQQRFAARSCVEDPERMRKLLPRLTPFLPDIVTGLQGLDGEGLATLLLVAPDAPLTPSALADLAQVLVRPLGGDEPRREEQLYQLRGLRDPSNTFDPAGPDSVVFGMIGDDFVVGSDHESARAAARFETAPHGEPAASATRIPASLLLSAVADSLESKLASRLVQDLVVGVAADPAALTARARLDFRP
jgi:hypothetical protein